MSDRIEPLICSACDGSGIDGSHDAALYYADRGELSPCPNCDGTGNRIEPLSDSPCDWDQESYCVERCGRPATHRRLVAMTGDSPIYELVCCRHGGDGIEPLFNPAEMELLQDAVAGWLARYLMRAERMDGEPADGFDFELMTTVGRKLGMDL